MTATLATPLAEPANEWARLAARAKARRRTTNILLYGFLAVGALPVLVPYLWLFTVAMSGRTGASTVVLWRTLAVLIPALFLWSMLRLGMEPGRRLRILEIAIDTEGNVRSARVLRSIPIFDDAAIAAVEQWKFTPTLLNGAPVPVIMTVTVNFTLE